MNKEEYETYKLITAIMYYYNNEVYYKDSFDIAFLEMMKKLVSLSVERGYLSNNAKENINRFLVDVRNYEDENRNKRINIINDILRIMNHQKDDKTIEFYRMQLSTRRNDKKYLTKYSDYVIKKEISEINLSIVYDYLVVYSHSNEITDEEFINDFLPGFVTSTLYYESINAILEENPSMFKDMKYVMCIKFV